MKQLLGCRLVALVLAVVGLVAAGSAVLGEPQELVVATPGGVDLGLRLDLLAAILLTFIATLSWLIASYSIRNLAGQQRTDRFGWLLLLATGSLALMVTGASLPIIALGWTLSGIALAMLVGHSGSESAARAARFVSRRLLISDLLLWVGVVLALLLLPSVNRAELATADLGVAPATVVAAVLAAAAVIRSALVPVQTWLPETAEAPSPVSALLHAGIVNGAGIIGALAWPIFRAAPAVLLALLLVGVLSVAFGTLAARVRVDVKGRLACSTTSQMGYMTIQLGLGLPAAAIAHLIGHGYYKAWLFLRAGGAVGRERVRPAAPHVSSHGSRRRALAWVVPALAIGVALGGPAAALSIDRLGITALVPGLLALVTIAVAVAAVANEGSYRPRIITLVALGAGLSAGAYQWLLLVWEEALAGSLPLTVVWSALPGSALVIFVVAAGAATAMAARRIALRPVDPLAVRLSASALPPSQRTWPGAEFASWPTTPAAAGPADAASAEVAPEHSAATTPIAELVEAAAALTAPNWPLRSYVAANPLSQLERFGFEEAAEIAAEQLGAQTYLPLAEYAEFYESGRITDECLRQVLSRRSELTGAAGEHHRVDALTEDLVRRARSAADTAATRMRDTEGRDCDLSPKRFTAALDAVTGGAHDLSAIADQHAALWTQRAWGKGSDEATDPWRLWHAVASTSAYDKAVGLAGVSRLVRELPVDPEAALVQLLDRSGLPRDAHFAYVSGLLVAGPGWASHAHWRAREAGAADALIALSALRCALDLLIAGSANGGRVVSIPDIRRTRPFGTVDRQREDREVWQSALEAGFQNNLLERLGAGLPQPAAGLGAGRADAQAIFCIDVRSERIRRALERTRGSYQTFGFAGFFGAALRYEPSPGVYFDQCPVLIKPNRLIVGPARTGGELRPALRTATSAISGTALTPLMLAEAGGSFSALAGLLQMTRPRLWRRTTERWGVSAGVWEHVGDVSTAPPATGGRDQGVSELPVGFTVDDRTVLAQGALQAIGLVDDFARIILVCGHAATTENNAYATGYDCGACGGNGGQLNARVLADALNDPAVRVNLARAGIHIPIDTVAVAASHNTTTDVVEIDPCYLSDPRMVDTLQPLLDDLRRAGLAVAAERAATLPGLADLRRGGRRTQRTVTRRGVDWSEPFPEWGLAGNAAFVIGPRSLTADLDLGGRVFLHSYQPHLDPDHTILETLLTAPAVVTQWINSQYYFSSVDPAAFGAGDKTTHNVIGDVGVLSGAHGDLRLGLPWQALFATDPAESRRSSVHEPLRLLVAVYATPETIAGVVGRHPKLAELFGNGWASLVALDPETGDHWRLTRDLSWRPCAESTVTVTAG